MQHLTSSLSRLAACALLALVGGCNSQENGTAPQLAPATAPQTQVTASEPATQSGTQIELGNTHYLFVLGEHDEPELLALLQRTEEITQQSMQYFSDLKIAMVIHGPSVRLFTRSAYPEHRSLVDLAARLDAFGVIDLKICQTSLREAGVAESEIPAFIDRVPYAPDEIRHLTESGYISL